MYFIATSKNRIARNYLRLVPPCWDVTKALTAAVVAEHPSLKKNRAIKSYIRRLPGLLAKDYGVPHTTGHADQANNRACRLDPIYSCYAIAMFSVR